MDTRRFGNIKVKKHSWIHRINPFNSLLRNYLHRNLLVPAAPKTFFSPPQILNQGELNACSEFGSYTIRSSVTDKTYVSGAYMASEQAFSGQDGSDGYDANIVTETAVLSGFKATDGTIDQPSASITIYSSSSVDMYDSIVSAVEEYQCPVGFPIIWYSDWESGQNGIMPNTATIQLGGHWTTAAGKTSKPLYASVQFPEGETDRLANPNTWGTQAPGSDQGWYYWSRTLVNSYIPQGYVWIYSSNSTVQLLGKLSALYTKVLVLLKLD